MMFITTPCQQPSLFHPSPPKANLPNSPQSPHTPSLKYQTRIIHDPPPHPPRRKSPQHMPMRHNQHILLNTLLPKTLLMPLLPYLSYKLVQPCAHIFRRLAALAPVAPDVPVGVEVARGAQLAYLGRGEAFIIAVVPFGDSGGYFDVGACAGVLG